MQQPDLLQLQSGSSAEWDLAFHWLWPSVFAVVNGKLGEGFPADVEDVALESIEALVEAVRGVKSIDELRLVAIGVARNKAVDFLRRRWAVKRGGGKVDPLPDDEPKDSDNPVDPAESPLGELDARELAFLLGKLLKLLQPRDIQLLTDFFVHALSYAQIAEKRAMPMGSVGVMLARARNTVREIMNQNPWLLKELKGFLR